MTSLKPFSSALLLVGSSLLATACSSNGVTPTQVTAQPSTPTSIITAAVDATPKEEPLAKEDAETTEEALSQTPDQTDTTESNTLAIEEVRDSAAIEPEHPATTLFKFGFDKKELDADSIAQLKQHGAYLGQHPEIRITINGHADNQGDANYNQQLSLQRAQYVAAILQQNGATEQQIEIFSWGATDPLADAKHPQDNRRVELEYGDEYLAKTVF